MSTQQVQRFRWATYNTWGNDRRKARRISRKAYLDLIQLIQAAPAALAAAHNRRLTMNDHYWSDEAMEARQEARRQRISRCGNPPRAQREAKPPTEREELLAAGMYFSVREDDLSAAAADDRERQRRAEQELASQQRLYDQRRGDVNLAFLDPNDAA
ncbi:hypothetical protein OHB39_06270 [Streptomyces sp. NBC_00047]|uniref:hypothetical protein n=1 Tax=Streptomyces sp. NBC_00047 TaxID=2975627 RepID=UPI00225675DC|nr:hypothetical protein [Streptomyces sp. NBC_00047]MCX5607188.1 hypothetical protein [Streptomyces sp. NBC_00047]